MLVQHCSGAAACPSSGNAPADPTDEAHEFIHLFHAETGIPGAAHRWREVSTELARRGTWTPTTAELTHGARVAWRQSARCIGRLRWQSLQVRDLRHVTRAADVHRELLSHLSQATNHGRVRSMISVFAPDQPNVGPRVRVWNEQLCRYAGWSTDGGIVGDPRYVQFADLATKLGWRAPRASRRHRFNVLPWVIETAEDEPQVYPVPRRLVREVRLTHPMHGWFGELGMRWHAVPVISHMRLRIGGVDFSCAPFGGFYLAAEIATRNLADPDRYDLLPVVARHLGLHIDGDVLWRDKALLVLQEAVLHSFAASGTTVVDHHGESRNFDRFVAREEAAGRVVLGDWSWLNPYPMTPQDPSWQRYYASGEPSPNFYLDPEASDAARGVEPEWLVRRHRQVHRITFDDITPR